MIRTALRLSTIAALLGGGVLPFPTLVGPQVWDSRKDDLSDVTVRDRLNIIIVRTDEDVRSMRDPKNGRPVIYPVRRSISLRLELATLTGVVQPGTATPVVGWPTTDAGIEAMLDLLEFQIEAALLGDWPWSRWWRNMWQPEEFTSIPIWSQNEDTRVRWAARELTIPIFALFDCKPRYQHPDWLEKDTNGDPIIIEEVPEPLNAIFNKIDDQGGPDLKTLSNRIRTQILARDLPVPPVAPLLTSVPMRIPEGKTPAGQTPLIDLEAELIKPL